MFQASIVAYGIKEVNDFLSSIHIREQVSKSKSVLVQIFTARLEYTFLEQLNESIRQAIPYAVTVGATTSGEIVSGKSIRKRTVISFSFFEDVDLKVIALNCQQGLEYEIGADLSKKIAKAFPQTAGVLLLATTQTIDGGKLLEGMRPDMGDYPLFGAGAGSYENNHDSFIFYGNELYAQGVVAVVFSGRQLFIEAYTYIGWQTLSKEMTITEIGNGMLLRKIDGVPAASIYEKYLGIRNDDKFFENVIEFPLMIQRDGSYLARIPVACGGDGSISLVADVREGEKVRLSYGSPESIILNAYNIQKTMKKFGPEGILLYTCNCRQIFLLDSVQLETQPFESIAPTTGFYTYGEFYGRGEKVNLLNATMVAVGMREGAAKQNGSSDTGKFHKGQESRQIELASRLVHFIEAVVAELEDTNEELQTLLDIDQLTQLYNRGKIDTLMQSEIERAGKNEMGLSIILLDIDHFKQVNDMYGHHEGDNVLKQVAATLKSSIRSKDVVGRWGGEEFMILLRDTGLEMAEMMAERIRKIISETDFKVAGKITASFGVVSAGVNEDETQVFKRVDDALYKAKNSARNKVVSLPGS